MWPFWAAPCHCHVLCHFFYSSWLPVEKQLEKGALCSYRASGCSCELGESGFQQGGDGGVVLGLGEGKGSGAFVSKDARVCIRCKESPDYLDVANLG